MSQFNKGVKESRDLDRRQKAIDKADRRRMDSAARMKVVLDGEPSAAEREAAESDYREALGEWQKLVAGSGEADDDTSGSEVDGGEAVTDEVVAGLPDAEEASG